MRGPWVALAAGATLLLSACSDGGASEGGSGDGADDSTVTGPAAGQEVTGSVTVLAAASLTDVFAEIEGDFESSHEGVSVEVSYAASSTIVQQVNGGAPADVVALAGTGSLEPLDPDLRASEEMIFTTNSLQLAVPSGNPAGVTGLADLENPDLTIVVCAEQVPCGRAAGALFQEQDLTPQIASYEPDVRATLSKVALGEADVGVVYRTDVAAAGDPVEGVEIPEESNVINDYPILTVSDNPAGQQFIDHVLSEGQERLSTAGFVGP